MFFKVISIEEMKSPSINPPKKAEVFSIHHLGRMPVDFAAKILLLKCGGVISPLRNFDSYWVCIREMQTRILIVVTII